MLGLFVFGLISTAATVLSAPVAGPNYDNIQYLHNFTLTYANNSLEGMGAIDNLTDVNPQMAQNLKSAINLALPGYLASSRSSTVSSTGTSSGTSGVQTSTAMPMGTSTMNNNMPGRKKRQVMATSTTTVAPMATSEGPQGPSTTQPYGTDEEFYARTDLVHFHVDINDLEGSGAI